MNSPIKWFRLLSGLAFILIAITMVVNPVNYLVNLSWFISLGLFISAISSLLNYLSLPRELKHPIYLLDVLVNVIIAFYLFTRGFAVLPFVVPTILSLWLIFQAISLFIKGRRLSYVLPFVGSNVSWVAVLALILGLVLLFNPLGTGVFIIYLIAFAFFMVGIAILGGAFGR